MARKPISSIPSIPETDSRKRDPVNSSSIRDSPRHVTQDSKLKPIKTKHTAKLPPLKESLLTDKGSRLPDISTPSVSTRTHTPRNVHSRTVELFTPTYPNSQVQSRLPNTTHAQITESISPFCDVQRSIDNDTEHDRLHKDITDLHSVGACRTNGAARHSVERQNNEARPVWFEQRERLRQIRKQAEMKKTAALKPLKATKVFKEKKRMPNAELSREKGIDPYVKSDDTKKRQTCARLQKDDNASWKDAEQSEETVTKVTSRNTMTASPSDSSRAGSVAPLRPRGTECSKKGVGFRSKSRMAKLKADEHDRVESERKERERLEARIPKNIRKDFVKYGFR